jgi:hypothetical protein
MTNGQIPMMGNAQWPNPNDQSIPMINDNDLTTAIGHWGLGIGS